jgi:putative transposase
MRVVLESFQRGIKKASYGDKIVLVSRPLTIKLNRRFLMKKDSQSLSHTTCKCKYHIVFAPKYRRQIIYGKYKQSIGEILRELCERKGVEIIKANACKDHVHMLVSIPPKLSVSSFIGYLKGKSSLMIFDRHANLKYRYGNRKFWCRGYYVDTVGRNKKQIEE